MFQIFNRINIYHQGFFLVIVATLLFSMKGIFIKLAYVYHVEPAVLMFIRMMIALPFYFFVLFSEYRSKALQHLNMLSYIKIMVLGFFGYYLASYLDLTGLKYLPASLERLVLYSYPSIVLILSVLFLGRRLEKSVVVSLLVVYAGLLSVFAQDIQLIKSEMSEQLWGALLVFSAAASFAIYLLGSEVMMQSVSSKLFTALAMLSASVAIVIHYFFNFDIYQLFDLHVMVFVYGAIIAIFCTVLPSFMLSSGVKRIGAATGSVVGSLGPIVTLIMAVVILDEVISFTQGLGFLLVILGVINLGRAKKTSKNTVLV
jgi:drug/metabolite transporter (DMT)-like permease